MKPTGVHCLLVYRTLLIVITLLLLYIQVGCEGGNNISVSMTTPDTGTISFDVVWNQGSDIDTDYQAMAVICGSDPAQVATVSGAIVNIGTSFVKMGGPWDCLSGSGIIQGVPVGTGYSFLIYGHNEQSRATYSGIKQGISVNTGPNDIGTIEANQFFTEISTPADASSGINPDNATFSWLLTSGAAEYQLWISESVDLSAPLIFITDDLSFTVPAGSLDAEKTYYWTVFPIDIYDNRSWFYGAIYSFMTASGGTITDDNYEENDTLGTAYDISGYEQTNLSSINGLGIANLGDDDWYQIEVMPGYEYLTIDCSFVDPDGDIDIELYTLNGTFVKRADSDTDNEHIELDLTAYGSGTYYIRVYLYSGGSNTYDLWWDDTSSVVGTWSLDYDWDCDGAPGTATITFNGDYTFTTSDVGTGTWTLVGDQIEWTYDTSPFTTYTGTVNATFDHIAGTMSNDTGLTGCFTATPL